MNQYTQLTEGERNQIYALLKEDFTQAEVAKRLKRWPSTISREVKRNSGGRGYRPKQAQRLTNERRKQASSGAQVSELAIEYMLEKLTKLQWSPEQIADNISKDIGEKLSHEWIYQYIYTDRKT